MRSADHDFLNDVAAASAARRFATTTLHDWGMDGLGDDVALLVSELVTNVVRHTASGGVVHLTECSVGVHIDVADGSGATPAFARAELMDVSGRGLGIVDRLAETWGIDRRADGKSVWFELAATDRAQLRPA